MEDDVCSLCFHPLGLRKLGLVVAKVRSAHRLSSLPVLWGLRAKTRNCCASQWGFVPQLPGPAVPHAAAVPQESLQIYDGRAEAPLLPCVMAG